MPESAARHWPTTRPSAGRRGPRRATVATQSGATWGLDRIDQRDLPLRRPATPTTARAPACTPTSSTPASGRRTRVRRPRAATGFTAIGDGRHQRLQRPRHARRGHRRRRHLRRGQGRDPASRCACLDCTGSGTQRGRHRGRRLGDGRTTSAPAVANMSLGGGASTALDDAVSNSIAAGVTYAIAAGNSNADACNCSPARVPAAHHRRRDDQHATRGRRSRTSAPASTSSRPARSITSAWNTSDTATNTISGTSMASPHVARAWPRSTWPQNGQQSPATVRAGPHRQRDHRRRRQPGHRLAEPPPLLALRPPPPARLLRGSGVLRQLRDQPGLDDEPARHRYRHHRQLGARNAAADHRPAASCSSVPAPAARTAS